MSTVNSLQNELKSLSQLTRKRSPQIHTLCNASLSQLAELLSTSNGSNETVFNQLATNPQYSEFISPLIASCCEPDAKTCASSLQIVQILAQFQGIPLLQIDSLLSSLSEASKQGTGIQLKVLQVLPSLLYGMCAELTGDQIQQLLAVCLEMLGSNKIAMVQNTAYATLQQLITGVFDRISLQKQSEDVEISIQNHNFKVSEPLHDAVYVLLDLCDLAEDQPPHFLKISNLSLTFTLELFELTLTNQSLLFEQHDSLNAVLRLRIAPLLLRSFVDESSFPVVLRVSRIFYLLLRKHLSLLQTGSEVILSTLIHHSQKGELWKQVLCLEVLQGVCTESDLLIKIFTLYDENNSRSEITQSLVSVFAKMFSENSKFVLASEISLEEYNDAVSGASAATSASSSTETDIMVLSKNSALKVAVLDVIDRAEPPEISLDYKYYLILKCLVSLVDNIHEHASSNPKISNFLQSLSNPLLLFHSIALGIAMDVEMYKFTVRSAQRLAHTSGILQMKKLRDEFMMIIIQFCNIPEGFTTKLWLSVRCCLCIRAVFSLGYALGNQLETSWSLLTQVITKLFEQIEPEFEPSIENLLGTEDKKFKVILMSLNVLLQNTESLSDSAIRHFISSINPEDNSRHFLLLQSLALVNNNRLATADTQCWEVFASKLLLSASKGSVDAANVLNLTAYELMHHPNQQDPNQTHSIVMHTFSSIALNCPEPIKIMCLDNLNDILEKFGGNMTKGWDFIFNAISPLPSSDGSLELLKSSFRTLELITSDFLENLPYDCVFSLTICLDEFSRQTNDLNISFTSTSLIWSVCDYLIRHANNENLETTSINSEEDLIAAAQQDSKSPAKRSALWLLALLKLARIARFVDQQQVRSSALQIFLKLFSTHGNKLSMGVWNVAFQLVLPELIGIKVEMNEYTDTQVIIIEGVFKIISLFDLAGLESFQNFWKLWLHFVDGTCALSAECASLVYQKLSDLVKSDRYPKLLKSIAEFWETQKFEPEYSEKEPKKTSDALIQLLNLYTHIQQECDSERSIELIGKVARFPFYTYVQERGMSHLQLKCVELLDSHCTEVASPALVRVLTDLAVLVYENKDPKRNYSGISTYAFSKLNSLNEFNRESLPQILSSMIIAIGTGEINKSASQIFLKTIELCESSELDEKSVLNGLFGLIDDCCAESGRNAKALAQTVTFKSTQGAEPLTTFSSTATSEGAATTTEDDALHMVSEIITTLKSKSLKMETWHSIILKLRDTSLPYERLVHNLEFYRHHTESDMENLSLGIVETPKSLNRTSESMFCLEMLAQLANDDVNYSQFANEQFFCRVKAVILQYTGDCKIRGKEPIREILELELLKILNLLVISPLKGNKQEMTTLILNSIPNSSHKILLLLQQMLMNLSI